ncbi:MAG: hypothetical protein ACC682_13040 [Gemmatimonadota bacterium]
MVFLRQTARLMAGAVLLVGLAACSDDDPAGVALPANSAILLSGSWTGGGGGFLLTLSILEDAEGIVTGSGTLSSAASGRILDVVGQHVFPELVLDLTSIDDGTVLTLQGVAAFEVLGSRITGITAIDGTLSGGGFDRLPIQLIRRELARTGGQGGF